MAELAGRALAPGRASGPVVRLDEPLSLWGGMDPATGDVIDRRHPQSGVNLTGCVLVMPSGRGSSSSSTILAESVRAGTGPVAIVLRVPDPIIGLGSIVAGELYGRAVPVVVLDEAPYGALVAGRPAVVRAGQDGAAVVQDP
jgi:predicted aconitase with swiveling domain